MVLTKLLRMCKRSDVNKMLKPDDAMYKFFENATSQGLLHYTVVPSYTQQQNRGM